KPGVSCGEGLIERLTVRGHPVIVSPPRSGGAGSLSAVAGTIAQIWRYPVKSMAGERLESTAITTGGLAGDRRWTLVDGSPNRAGKMLTNTQDARLMTYKARLVGEAVEVTTPSGSVERL